MLPTSAAIVRDGGGDSTPDEDQGVIRCICGINDDDGFTIQCENCLVWQHAVCVGVEQDNVPDEYLCEKCNPRKLDVKKAVEYQKRRLDTEYRNSKETRKKAKYVAGKAKKADDGSERKKRVHDGKQPRVKHTKGALGRDSSSPTTVRSGDGNRRESSSFADASYSQIEQNILGPDVQILFQSVLSQLAEQRNMVSAASASVSAATAAVAAAAAATAVSTTIAAVTESPPASADTAAGEHKALDSGTAPSSTTTVPPTAAAPASNNEGSIVVMAPPVQDNPSSLPSIVSLRSESLRDPAPTYLSLAVKGKSQIGLFARGAIEGGRYICEYKGQVILKAAYKEDPKNYYDLLRTTRPHTHFHPEIDLCVDARRQGSEARFVRSSCTANAVLQSIHISDGGESQIYLGLFAQRQIEPDEELTVAWKWEDGEMPAVARLSPSDAEDYLGRPEGRRMSKVWRQAFNGTSCACPDAQCVVRQLFAMLGVEESKADYGPEIKRRASRPAKGETDNPLSSPLAGSVRSPENGKPRRSSAHSRKASEVGLDGASADPPSPSAQRRQARTTTTNNSFGYENGSNADNVPGQAPGDMTGEQYVGDGRRKSSGDSNLRQTMDRPSDMEDLEEDDDDHERYGNEQRRGANGDDSNGLVSMEPSSSENGRVKSGEKRGRKRRAWQINGEGAHGTGPGSLGISTHSKGNGKKRRTSSNNPSSSSTSPTSLMLPQKKIWMSQYIELAGANAGVNEAARVEDIGGFVIEEPSPKKSPRPAAKTVAEPSPTAPSDSSSAVALPTQPAAVKTEDGSAMDVDSKPSAGAGKPDLEVSISGNEAAGVTKPVSPDAPATGTVPPSASSPVLSPMADGSSSGVPPKEPEQAGAEDAAGEQADASKSPADEEPSTASGEATSALAVPAPKKQRLSLEEYNKRRRVSHAPGTGSKEASSPAPAATSTSSATAASAAGDTDAKSETSNDSGSAAAIKELPAPAKVKVSLEEYNRRRKLSGTASIDSNITAAASAVPKDLAPPVDASPAIPLAAVPEAPMPSKTDTDSSNAAATTKPGSAAASTAVAEQIPSPIRADSVPSTMAIDTTTRRNSFSRSVRSPPLPPASAPVATRPSDALGRRGLLTPPPPPPPMPHASSHPTSGRFDDRGPNTYAGGRKASGPQNESYYRLERGAGGYYDDYERDRDGRERDRDGRDFRGRERESYRDYDMKDRVRSRDFNTPPPPPPPPPMHGPMSATVPGFHGHGSYRQRDREFGRRDGSLERESGEISFGRGRSRSRDRGGRMGSMGDRRYGGPMSQGGGGYYQSHNNNRSPPPARSLTPHSSNSTGDWRPSGYAPPMLSPHHSTQPSGASRGLSNSPTRRQQQQATDAPFSSAHQQQQQQPLPGLSTTSGSPVAAGGGYRGVNRRGGIGNNGSGSSRGGSPVRK